MTILGIDPGLSGAVCVRSESSSSVIEVWNLPTLVIERGGKKKRTLDADALASNVASIGEIEMAYVELSGSMPGQGVSSTFAYGMCFGQILGILAALKVPRTFVSAARWKRALRVPAAKDGARKRASELMPSAAHFWPLSKDHGRAEAALIAWWGVSSRGGTT
ncbi:MAG TPA: hypothetical protein VGR84_18795 [Candidatus Acidoferrales bacterium]|nr:hypothetical protein [Candidatus Acidoferrales bacterium]